MMRTLCVAAVVLSFISVCQSASLACEKLVKQVDSSPDISGKWYYIAISTELCLASTLINVLFWPSFSLDIVSTDKPNVYSGTVQFKTYRNCLTYSEDVFYVNSSFFDVDSGYGPTGEADVLLPTSCPDCLVVKEVDTIVTLALLSRRKVVTDDELKEFETQTRCLGWSKPQVLNSNHDSNKCQSVEEISEDEAGEMFVEDIVPKMAVRWKAEGHHVFKCIKEIIVTYIFSYIASWLSFLGWF